MSTPPLNNPNDKDDIIVFAFHESNELWPVLEDNSILPATEDYDIDGFVDPNVFHQENSSVAEASIDIEALLLEDGLENQNINSSSPVPFEPNEEWDSWVFLGQEKSAVAQSIIDSGLPESGNNYQEHSGMCIALEENCSMSLSNKSQDTKGNSDPSIFLEKENSAMDPSIFKNRGNSDIFSNRIEASDDPWPFVQEGSPLLAFENDENYRELEPSLFHENDNSQMVTLRINKELVEKRHNIKKKERNNATIEEHNAKERVRRMKLYSTYLSLGALLPDSQSKKKRSAPVIIDRALEYIPELESEIEKLTLKKNKVMSAIQNKQTINQDPELKHRAPTVSVNEVQKGEVIIQVIRIPKDEDTVFSKLLQNLEANGASIISVSTLQVCEKRVSYHLHLQMDKDALATDYVTVLREDVISRLL